MEMGGVQRLGRSGWAGACRWLAATRTQRETQQGTRVTQRTVDNSNIFCKHLELSVLHFCLPPSPKISSKIYSAQCELGRGM